MLNLESNNSSSLPVSIGKLQILICWKPGTKFYLEPGDTFVAISTVSINLLWTKLFFSSFFGT